jgi:glycyl-tRNA synthetase beta chain
MSANFLLEIGTEEIPSSYLPVAADQMRKDFERFLNENSLARGRISTLYTPRRLTLVVEKLASCQQRRTVKVLGPPAKLCLDETGSPTSTLLGFAHSHGVKPDRVKTTKTGKGEYVYFERSERARTTSALLKEYLPLFVESVSFPKSMRWTSEDFRFARPIRWILALYGERVIRFTVAGVKSANFTRGHRSLHPDKIPIKTPKEYVRRLNRASVIVDPTERLALIRRGLDERAQEVGGQCVMDEELLTEVNNLVEYPVCARGRFSKTYLELPTEVILTAMKAHQKYFGLFSKRGKLLPYFIAVISGDEKYVDEILDGNQRVLQARLDDALFYWNTDRRVPLGERIESLKDVVWLEGMGTLYHKTERLAKLASLTASLLGFDRVSVVKRAAWLSKTDLVTSMIKDGKEFTTLEGQIGMEYALQSGEPKDVAMAIYEHRLPRYPGDIFPETLQGTILAIADKLDTVVGGFIAGHIPTGSQDAHGLRRHTTAILSILIQKNISLNLVALVGESLKTYETQGLLKDGRVRGQILSFLRTRTENWLQEEDYRYDLVDAVLSTGYGDPADAKMRIAALNELRSSVDFFKLVIAQKRVANILKGQSEPGPLTETLLSEDAERQLFYAAKKLEPRYRKCIRKGDYEEGLRQLLSLRTHIDRLFDEVLIMAKDEALRMNRLALVEYMKSLFNEIGDLSKIVIE